jgi:hypothetical protein
VRKFYNTLVKQARATFLDARTQSERWMQAVVLPLEVQMKDHKAALQTRLDSLSKINEKTTSINEQMALLRKAEADLRSQRNMIESLIARVSAYEATASLDADLPETLNIPAARVAEVFGTGTSPTGTTTTRPGGPAKPATPLISDDLMAQLGAAGAAQPAPAFDPLSTQKLPADHDRTVKLNPGDTQRIAAQSPQNTQRLDIPAGPQATQPVGPRPTPAPPQAEGERTMKIKKLDPAFRPDAPKRPDAPAASPAPGPAIPGVDMSNAEVTQRLDDSIWRLQEAKRLLQKTQK